VPTEDLRLAIEGCAQAHVRLQETLVPLTDEQVQARSRLPGWSIGHVLTHLARNADSVVRRLEGAANGQVVDQYAGGHAGRAAEIEAGALRSAADLRADVVATSAAVESAIEAMPDSAWDNPARGVDGDEQPARAVVFSRWREVEVHHVDLGLGYEPVDWPPALVSRWLPTVVETLPDRADPTALLAWALGRGPAPDLRPWD
jgi:maleylpyruvate isomerase